MIFISWQGRSRDGRMPDDFASQAKNTFENIGRCLALTGASFEDIVKINYYVTDMANTATVKMFLDAGAGAKHPGADQIPVLLHRLHYGEQYGWA
jgi:enamine deaminase RidA (YjgF/YER057c/UK114 family)